jgi:hypothetical protein
VVTPADEFRALGLRCHLLLHDVPLHDVWVIDLAGGGPGRTMRDVDAIAETGHTPLAVRALFALRFAVGRALGWDGPRRESVAESYLHRLTDDDRARSLVTPGTRRGPFRTLYVFADEAVAEARNATVHAFLVMALRARAGGYRLYWAVYVKPVGRMTAIYMAVIDPFRRLIVYPALIRRTQAGWAGAYGARDGVDSPKR